MRDLMTHADQKTVTAEVTSVCTIDSKNGAGELVRICTRDGKWHQGFYEAWKDFGINEVLDGDTFEITYWERAGSRPGLVFRNFTKVRSISEEARKRKFDLKCHIWRTVEAAQDLVRALEDS